MDGLTVQGKTAGGADIYASKPAPGFSAVVYIVIWADDSLYTCGLSGGP